LSNVFAFIKRDIRGGGKYREKFSKPGGAINKGTVPKYEEREAWKLAAGQRYATSKGEKKIVRR